MAADVDARAIRGNARSRHRSARQLRPPHRKARRNVFLRGLRAAAFCIGGKIRERNRMAEFQRADFRRRRNVDGPEPRHGPHGSSLRQLRQPSRPCFRRWPPANPPAILHQWRRHEFHPRLRPSGWASGLFQTPSPSVAFKTIGFFHAGVNDRRMEREQDQVGIEAFACLERRLDALLYRA